MFILHNYSAAVICCMVTMLCWGSWANTQKLAASTWRFELFYWDYVLGILLFSVALAFTLGSMGSGGRGFLADLAQASGKNIGWAIVGGIVFNPARPISCWGRRLRSLGMAVAFPVGIGLALVIGVVVDYIAQPVGNAGLLTGGVALIVVAILLNAFAYRRLQAGMRTSSGKGLGLAVAAGILMGFFYKYVAAGMFSDFEVPEPGKLSPYTAVVIFSAGILLRQLRFQYDSDEETLFAGAPVSLYGVFQGRVPGPYYGDTWRIDLVSGDVAQYDRIGQGGAGDLVWAWAGRDDRRGVVGHLYLEGV